MNQSSTSDDQQVNASRQPISTPPPSERSRTAMQRMLDDADRAYNAVATAVATTWQERQRIKRLKLKQARRPGYPRTWPFPDAGTARAYLATPKIICLLCGQEFGLLNLHLLAIHAVHEEDYRLAYSLPWTKALIGSQSKERRSVSLKTRLSNPQYAEQWFANGEQNRALAHEAARHARPRSFENEGTRARMKAGGHPTGQWVDSDFLRILEVMKSEDKLLREVAGKFPGLPSYGTALRYFYSTPDRHAVLVSTYHGMSPRLQVRARTIGPALQAALRQRYLEGTPVTTLSRESGASMATIRKLVLEK